jgi:hypothetical protein
MRSCHATSPPKRHTSMAPSSASCKRTKAYPDHQLTVVGWCLGFLELEATVASSSWLLLVWCRAVPCRAVPCRDGITDKPATGEGMDKSTLVHTQIQIIIIHFLPSSFPPIPNG